ncbi:hypothetical protein FA15DRAFT_673067 [Coprinopsis marcescibilis]|uniref:Uncharacterized protein n=1 Tax=Coprinopsis marcescibilis TaxID=230819 RepID=A0A5C3KKM3_COPMA|nr:hypothetical protein FA15DRAFT_673067 [Coprinopsis marcescibilis]
MDRPPPYPLWLANILMEPTAPLAHLKLVDVALPEFPMDTPLTGCMVELKNLETLELAESAEVLAGVLYHLKIPKKASVTLTCQNCNLAITTDQSAPLIEALFRAWVLAPTSEGGSRGPLRALQIERSSGVRRLSCWFEDLKFTTPVANRAPPLLTLIFPETCNLGDLLPILLSKGTLETLEVVDYSNEPKDLGYLALSSSLKTVYLRGNSNGSWKLKEKYAGNAFSFLQEKITCS